MNFPHVVVLRHSLQNSDEYIRVRAGRLKFDNSIKLTVHDELRDGVNGIEG
jgi:hypothetical protein